MKKTLISVGIIGVFIMSGCGIQPSFKGNKKKVYQIDKKYYYAPNPIKGYVLDTRHATFIRAVRQHGFDCRVGDLFWRPANEEDYVIQRDIIPCFKNAYIGCAHPLSKKQVKQYKEKEIFYQEVAAYRQKQQQIPYQKQQISRISGYSSGGGGNSNSGYSSGGYSGSTSGYTNNSSNNYNNTSGRLSGGNYYDTGTGSTSIGMSGGNYYDTGTGSTRIRQSGGNYYDSGTGSTSIRMSGGNTYDTGTGSTNIRMPGGNTYNTGTGGTTIRMPGGNTYDTSTGTTSIRMPGGNY